MRPVSPVREATLSDMPQLRRYAEAFAEYHPMLAALPADIDAICTTLGHLIENENACILIHDHGTIGGLVVPFWAAPEKLVASEMFWWAEREGGALLDAFEAWAESKGATFVQMLCIQGVRDVSPVYRRRGYAPLENAYIRELA